MLITKFLDPKNDYAFKRIFGTERNKDILICFINDILAFSEGHKIKEVSYLKPSQDPDIASKKQSLLDVLCKDEEGRQYIVEMQVARTTGFEKRAQYYAAKAYVNQLGSAGQYQDLKAIIFLAITDYVMFPESTEYLSNHVTLDKKRHSRDLKDFSFAFLELPKFNKPIDQLETMIEKWAYFFKHARETHEKDMPRIAGSDEVISKAYEELNRFSWTEKELINYESEQKRLMDEAAVLAYQLRVTLEEGRAQGLEQGLEQGRHTERLSIAKNMILSGMSMDIVRALTGLSDEEVAALA